MQVEFAAAGRRIGAGRPCFIIAEAGVNHGGDIEQALNLIDIAAECGADAVKFQTFDADRLALHDAPKAAYQSAATGNDESQHAMLRRLEISAPDHSLLVERCRANDIIFLSTPFDEQSADLLATLDVAAFKTPSGELTNLRFLQHVARKRKPMIVSTGMATLGEVEAAVHAIAEADGVGTALLHCVSNYPAAAADSNLRAIATLSLAFGLPVGYSDHTTGIDIALAAVALGACIIEKHFTSDRDLPGPDQRTSLEPPELARLVSGIRAVEAALGDGRKIPSSTEAATAAVARKSLVTTRDIASGKLLTDDDIAAKRPGTGLSPTLHLHVVGRRARVPIPAGTLLALEMLA